ncbi:transcriptional regulator GcvA [Leeia sp. TBRC 13508]|uniref:Transcriptional regulator GcvA n=1 Tax=Leeia speluncae TaxID=2884804 RepID=A0ABS8D4Y7_9NEIS|nr:transcriptional regulator GcvA [Leeia speluncae]MCB6183247.1 transcriptional regulator GcvA [Leeia speluncae]
MSALPIAAVRVFEVAARHESFQRAGQELFLSAGAVAHQVKLLENWLGVKLFLRQARGLVLTPAGKRYADSIRPLLAQIETISKVAQSRGSDDRLVTVSATPSLVTRWLMPRLGHWREKEPEVELRLLASVAPVDFLRDGTDVAIRLGNGPYHGLMSDILMAEEFCAVSSPSFLKKFKKFTHPKDLLGVPLLHDESESRIPDQIDWHMWMAELGVKIPATVTGLRFSHTYLTIEAAISGQGVAIASLPMVVDDLKAGRLVQVLPHRVPGPYQYHLLRLPDAERRPAVKSFCDWARAEAAECMMHAIQM